MMATGQFRFFFSPQHAVSLFGILPTYQRALESSTLLFNQQKTPERISQKCCLCFV